MWTLRGSALYVSLWVYRVFSSQVLLLGRYRTGDMGTEEIEILVLAGIAAFIGYRIYTVLGRRTGNEQRPMDPVSRRESTEQRRTAAGTQDDKVVPLPLPREPVTRPRNSVLTSFPPGSPVAAGLSAIRAEDPGFDAEAFLDGAKFAHEMIVKAFADGDGETLRPLLAEDVRESFDVAIDERLKAGRRVEFAFVGLKTAAIEEARLNGRIAEVTVKFVSELISATRDAAGAVVDGAVGVVREVTDVWTFARDVRSSDPNWKLVATAGAA
jgi:predicted lipid-binding transport protein (Tim44 family)